MTRTAWCAAWALLLLVAVPTPLTADEADDAWKKARGEAKGWMKTPGKLERKESTIAALARDDRPRAAQLLVDWSLKSLKFSAKKLQPAYEDAREDFEKTQRVLLKSYEKMPPTRTNDKKLWKAKKAEMDLARHHVEAEALVLTRIGRALERMTSRPTVRWVAQTGLAKLAKVAGTGPVQIGAVRGLLNSDAPEVRLTALQAAGPTGGVKVQVEVLHWIAEKKPREGFRILLQALTYKHPTAKRAAIWGLKAYDNLEAVKPMIDAFAHADGMVAEELEEALHHFTGQSFNADGSVWKRWWQDGGEAWVAKGISTRHQARPKTRSKTGTSFYDIPTPSLRIVFVLDRSGSMAKEAGEKSKKLTEPRGPITGKKSNPNAADGPVAGSTKMEVAKNQLARSIRNLAGAVHFNVVFYSSDVQVWQDPPKLMPATRANKEAAIEWFMKLDAEGATALFAALQKALEYAKPAEGAKKGSIEGGADTIYLLSDGSPTEGGELLPKEKRAERYKAFLEANKRARCIVHTIGVGPKHQKSLMRGIAKDSGGEYRAVGMD